MTFLIFILQYVISQFSLVALRLFFFFKSLAFSILSIIYLGFSLLLFGCSWDSEVSGLLYYINFGKFLAIIFSDISSILLLSFFCDFAHFSGDFTSSCNFWILCPFLFYSLSSFRFKLKAFYWPIFKFLDSLFSCVQSAANPAEVIIWFSSIASISLSQVFMDLAHLFHYII